ncbi:MAG: DUF438 domain-containing protein [Anaerolineae bacterium]|jgi:hypothetical protein|nr:DUF438 domain-containing protein [Anaerolineae bacterium]
MSEFINNQTQREEKLKSIIRLLHEGRSVDEVKAAFADLLADVGPDEIVRIEEALVNEGLDPAEIEPLCDVHVAVFQDTLDSQRPPETVPGHPVFTFRAENLGVQRALDGVGEALNDYIALPRASTQGLAQKALAHLREYDKHYLRKENLLFPFLEHKGFMGPTKVMWGVHDEVRRMWKALAAALETAPVAGAVSPDLQTSFGKLAETIRSMVYKEEHILFPAALERLTDDEWAAIRDQGDEIGYCYARPGRAWVPGQPTKAQLHGEASPVHGAQLVAPEGAIALSVGLLTAEQVDLMLRSLPVDITFVDENDEVRYFSQGRERIFQRSPAIIGRKVQNCHPPQSVDRVQRIVDDFRAGKRDTAEFWIQMAPAGEPLFVHIRYFALRDASGAYRGSLEVSQNLTPLRALEGERRLLDE